MQRLLYLIVLAPLLLAGCGSDSNDAAPEGSTEAAAVAQTAAAIRNESESVRVFIVSPKDGETVSSPVKVVFGIQGKVVAPAGKDVPNSGHHHLLIDLEELPDMTLPIPNDDQHRHFGGGQTEAEIELAPGTHTLQLLLGDLYHVPHDPPLLSERISITVED